MKYLEQIKSQITPDTYYNCRLWDGPKVNGVPVLRVEGKKVYLRKHLWLEINSLIPRGFRVKMVCENFECVNPNHMVLEPMNPLVDWTKMAGYPDVERVFEVSKRNRAAFRQLVVKLGGSSGSDRGMFSYAEKSQDF